MLKEKLDQYKLDKINSVDRKLLYINVPHSVIVNDIDKFHILFKNIVVLNILSHYHDDHILYLCYSDDFVALKSYQDIPQYNFYDVFNVIYPSIWVFEDYYSPIIHGKTCKKADHVRDGYLHREDDDTPYDVDGCKYCGRCHTAL